MLKWVFGLVIAGAATPSLAADASDQAVGIDAPLPSYVAPQPPETFNPAPPRPGFNLYPGAPSNPSPALKCDPDAPGSVKSRPRGDTALTCKMIRVVPIPPPRWIPLTSEAEA